MLGGEQERSTVHTANFVHRPFSLFSFLFVASRRPPRTLTVVFPPRTVVFPSLGGVLRRSSTLQCFSNREMMIVALGGARVVQLSFRKPNVLSRIRLSVIFLLRGEEI